MHHTRQVFIGGAGRTRRMGIGGDAPVSIQTMWKEGITGILNDRDALLSIVHRMEKLQSLGCDIIRFAVPDMESADALVLLAKETDIPLVADIHFDYKLALRCLEGNVAKIRINPGNIGSRDRVEAVVARCKDKGAAIRIGVNTGSLPQDIAAEVRDGKLTRAQGLSQTAAREAEVLDGLGFDQFVVSMKASSVAETVDSNRDFAARFDIPLHVGVTEAGPLVGGIVKSTLAFSRLLEEGIGNTIRVSLSSTPDNEVITAREILRETGHRSGGVKIVSCPRCGRNGFDVHAFMDRWESELLSMDKDITVAVMGCVVNGPGEGKHADIGITGAGDKVTIFKHGKIVQTVSAESADTVFRKELLSL